MKKFILIYFLIIFTSNVFANQFYPEFDKMKLLRCEISETMYNQDNSVISKNSYHRFFRIDDENSKIYLQKAPVDNLLYYGLDKIQFKQETMSDDYIINSNIIIDRSDYSYSSTSRIIYDNVDFGVRNSKAQGSCKFID
ncbi:hypothetical protein J6G99_08460 [bacterium]|nr:hypothetical protein [bacterium]